MRMFEFRSPVGGCRREKGKRGKGEKEKRRKGEEGKRGMGSVDLLTVVSYS